MVRPLSRFLPSPIFPFDHQVLWLGNSYTFYNDLPTMVARLAAAQGKSILYSNHTESSWSWKTHAESQLTMELIRSQAWDVVVLQEQSRKPAYPAQTVCDDSIRHLSSLVVAIKANNPETILQVSKFLHRVTLYLVVPQFYLTWGRPFGSSEDCPTYPQFCDFPSMQVSAPYCPAPCENVQAALTTSYRAFACQNPPARVAPVGEAFATFWDSDNFLSLYKVQFYQKKNIDESRTTVEITILPLPAATFPRSPTTQLFSIQVPSAAGLLSKYLQMVTKEA